MTGPLSSVLSSSEETSAGRKGIVVRIHLNLLLGLWMGVVLQGLFPRLGHLEIPSSALPRLSKDRGGFKIGTGIAFCCLSYEFSNFTTVHGGRLFFVMLLHDEHV